jgi:hypothetical protein
LTTAIAAQKEAVEIILVQVLSLEEIDFFVHQAIEGELHGVFRFPVLGRVQFQSALIGFEKGEEGPVLGVDLGPDRAPVLEFGQGLQRLGAGFHGPEVLPADAGQVEHGRMVVGHGDRFDLSSDGAPEPDGGAGPVFRVVVAQSEQLRHLQLKPGDDGLPLAVFVRPEDAGGGDLDFRIVDGGVADGLDKAVEDGGHLAPPAMSSSRRTHASKWRHSFRMRSMPISMAISDP